MTEKTQNLILAQLRTIRAEQDASRERDREMLRRITQIENLKRDMSHITDELVSDRHSVDGLRERIERIERRLDLVD